MRKILIIGATSAIAEATARLYATEGHAFFLVARSAAKLQTLAQDLTVRGASQADFMAMDANDFDQHQAMLNQATEALQGLNMVIVAHGILSDQKAGQADYATFERDFNTNFLSAASMLTQLGNQFEQQGFGTIVVISSVAGDRGRRSNYVYGTAKAALSTFAQGLRSRLSVAGVDVITIKPGFVATPMTAHLKQGPLFAEPEAIAHGIHKAVERKKEVVYLPWFWFIIMTIVKHIPEPIFKRLNF